MASEKVLRLVVLLRSRQAPPPVGALEYARALGCVKCGRGFGIDRQLCNVDIIASLGLLISDQAGVDFAPSHCAIGTLKDPRTRDDQVQSRGILRVDYQGAARAPGLAHMKGTPVLAAICALKQRYSTAAVIFTTQPRGIESSW